MDIHGEAYSTVLDAMEERLNTIGEIKTRESWEICRHLGLSFSTVYKVFTHAMNVMVEQKKAVKHTRGIYEIIIPNSPIRIDGNCNNCRSFEGLKSYVAEYKGRVTILHLCNYCAKKCVHILTP